MVEALRDKAGAPQSPDESPIPQVNSSDGDMQTGDAEGNGRGRLSPASAPEAPTPRQCNANPSQSSSSGVIPPDTPPPFNPDCRKECEELKALLKEEQQMWEEERERFEEQKREGQRYYMDY